MAERARSRYGVLLAGRVAQGIGGAALLTIGLACDLGDVPGTGPGRALGLYFAAGAIAAVVGPLVGGRARDARRLAGHLLGPGAARRWHGRRRRVDGAAARRPPGRHRPLDAPGLALGSLVLLGINGALLQGDVWGWTSAAVIGGVRCSRSIALVAFVWRERTTPEPAIHLEILRSRRSSCRRSSAAAAWFGILSGSVQLAVYLQEVRGLSPTEAALVLLPWPLLAAVLFPRAAAIVARIGAPRVMVWSLVFALRRGGPDG